MSACFCMGPQNGDPLCPCKMGLVRQHQSHPTNWPTLSPTQDEDAARALRAEKQYALDSLHAAECEIARLLGLFSELRAAWFKGGDLDKDHVSQEALRIFIEAERGGTLTDAHASKSGGLS